MRNAAFTEETFDIAIHLATTLTQLPGFACRTATDLAYTIEKELAKYIKDGKLKFIREGHTRQ